MTIPLAIIGGLTGRMRIEETLIDVGDKLPKISKTIPRQPIYLRFIPSILISGILPFRLIII